MTSRWRHPKLVAVVGTNASGKSNLGIQLAKSFSGEVISADSRQVYRGLDLAAGKLSAQDMQGVRHHLIDIVDFEVRFSLADFQRLAYEVIDEIIARQHQPFLVGGTGMYVRSVVQGYQLTDAAPDLALRRELEQFGDDELWQRLRAHSPEGAQIIDPRNRRRLIRAIEVVEKGHSYRLTPVNSPRYEMLELGLTWPRDVLRSRIEVRLRQRISAGMIAEAQAIIGKGVSHERLEDLGLEYRHISRYLLGHYRDQEELIEQLGSAIWRFSARQMSWFRRDQSIIWLDTAADYYAEAARRVREFLAS
jgi:tRNA dimethylallyltransferase